MKFSVIQTKGFDCIQFPDHLPHIEELIIRAAQERPDMIVLPETTVPGYYISPDYQGCVDILSDESWKERIAALARQYSVYIAIGYIKRCPEGLYNRAIVFSKDGSVAAETSKSNMWHIDRDLFVPGRDYVVFDTEYGRIGLLICADARIPEIARILKLKGAQIIVDTANLVSNAPDVEKLTNQQLQFIIASRAAENRIPIVLSNKCGCEYDAVFFAGQSFAVDRNGNLIAQASIAKEEILSFEVELSCDGIYPARRPELYSILTAKVTDTPAYAITKKSYRLEDIRSYAALSKFSAADSSEYLEKARRELGKARTLKVSLALLPTCPDTLGKDDIRALQKELPDGLGAILSSRGPEGWRAYFLTDSSSEEVLPTHIEGREADIQLIQHGGQSYGFIFDDEVMTPELARCMMLKGADAVIWLNKKASSTQTRIIRTRAAENKLFTIDISMEGRSFAVNPDGAIYSSTFADQEMTITFMIDAALCRNKTVVPGTEIVEGRIPEAYTRLLEN